MTPNKPTFVLLWLTLAAPAFGSTVCPDGRFHADGVCRVCPDGTYTTAPKCAMAPSGKFIPDYGRGSRLAPDGTYIPNTGSMVLCPDGIIIQAEAVGYSLMVVTLALNSRFAPFR